MKKTVLFFLVVSFGAAYVSGSVITGVVRDARTEEPIAFASVRVVGSSASTSANHDGAFRLVLSRGDYVLRVSHIAHYSDTAVVHLTDSTAHCDIYLQPTLIEVSDITVYDQRYSAAQRIIVEAIKRKEDILSRLKMYSFEAYTKLVVRDTAKADSAEIALITETQVKAYWKYPNKHKQIIVARKQSSNIEADQNLVSVGELLNFNKNRIDFGRYAVVSPTATDALDHYNYLLLDTLVVDGQNIFLLEIEPRSDAEALFRGTIKILDSSYAVAGVDVTLNESFDMPLFKQVRYLLVYSHVQDDLWMPSLEQVTGLAHLAPFPVYGFDFQASVHGYSFDTTRMSERFDEYVLEVDRGADDVDSATWNAGQVMPLTELERYGYFRIDSLKNNVSLGRRLRGLAGRALGFVIIGNKDLFHFNRVEGAYLGAGRNFERVTERFDVRTRAGYAFDAKLWQYRLGLNYIATAGQTISFDLEYHDQVTTRPTVFAPSNGNATLMAIVDKTDAYDYYLETGLAFAARAKLSGHFGLTLGYNIFDQQSLENSTEYSMLRESKRHRPNPAIVDGRLRSLEAALVYDSRPLMRVKARDIRGFAFPLTRLRVGAEHSSRDLTGGDFEFTRYYVALRRSQRLFGWIISSAYVYAGASDGNLPPQKYFTVDFDAGLVASRLYFHSLGQTNFGGSRVLAVYTYHDLGRELFQKSGIPLVDRIPFTLQLFGGVFWTDFKHNTANPDDELIRTAPTPYGEIGFSVGRLLPLGLGVSFVWQMSVYDTKRFDVDLAFTGF
ncbi:MAG: carboxypeptidase-like regulatory domain-containing protein [Candidatus Zixiibacteriota bacterium]|nr:MAG: carboxypeptidase-like regulatory domain-containing protein [candidate division Zixibacteria bacterium]